MLPMTEQEMDYVCRLVARGAQLYIGHSPSGNRRIKLVFGIFGWNTLRFDVSHDELTRFEGKLREARLSKG